MDWILATTPQTYQELLIEHFFTDVLPVTETTSKYKNEKTLPHSQLEKSYSQLVL